MEEIYKKIGDDLEITVERKRVVTKLQLLKEKERAKQDKIDAEAEVTRIQARIDALNAKIAVLDS